MRIMSIKISLLPNKGMKTLVSGNIVLCAFQLAYRLHESIEVQGSLKSSGEIGCRNNAELIRHAFLCSFLPLKAGQ